MNIPTATPAMLVAIDKNKLNFLKGESKESQLNLGSGKQYVVKITGDGDISVNRDLSKMTKAGRVLNALVDFFSRLTTSNESSYTTRATQIKSELQRLQKEARHRPLYSGDGRQIHHDLPKTVNKPRVNELGLNEQRSNATETVYRKEQVYDNSCGAVSLLCAAKELGIDTIPALKGSISERKNNCRLETDLRTETDIYRITSGSSLGAQPIKDLHDAGYSLPHNIVLASRLLNLEADVYMKPNIFSKVLAHIYPECITACKGSDIPILQTPPRTPNEGERLIKLVVCMDGATSPSGLHWVMKRDDGSYMDPGNGLDSSDFKQMNYHQNPTGTMFPRYVDTGISLLLRRGSNNS